MDFLSYINCCVVLSCGNGQNKHRNSMWLSYRTLIAVWYCPVVMGKKTIGMGKKNHRNSMWISYGTLIAVWYCPVVMGKKNPQEWANNHRNGQKTHRNIMWYFLWYINCCVVLSCGNGDNNAGICCGISYGQYVVFPVVSLCGFSTKYHQWNKIYKK